MISSSPIHNHSQGHASSSGGVPTSSSLLLFPGRWSSGSPTSSQTSFMSGSKARGFGDRNRSQGHRDPAATRTAMYSENHTGMSSSRRSRGPDRRYEMQTSAFGPRNLSSPGGKSDRDDPLSVNGTSFPARSLSYFQTSPVPLRPSIFDKSSSPVQGWIEGNSQQSELIGDPSLGAGVRATKVNGALGSNTGKVAGPVLERVRSHFARCVDPCL